MSTKILIVEDELIIAEDMKIMLEHSGYHVIGVALSYNEATKLLSENTPDIAVIDINLGGAKDGIDLADYINKIDIPLIFATSNADPLTLERAKKTTSHGYLLKPFSQIDLHACIEMAIANFKKQLLNDHKIADSVFIKEDDYFVKVKNDTILYLRSDRNYTEVHTTQKRYVVRGTVKDILNELDGRFFRIHKSYVVNLSKIDAISTTFLKINEQELPIGKMHREELLSRIRALR